MKKYIIIMILLLIGLGLIGGMEGRYTRGVTVVDIEEDIVVVEDEGGNLWEFEGEGYYKGDNLTITLSNNYTTKITDDEIIKVK